VYSLLTIGIGISSYTNDWQCISRIFK